MIITQSGKIIFEPIEFKNGEIKKGKLFVSKFSDSPGILYKITGVLFVHNWNIVSAEINTINGEIEDEFVIQPIESSKLNKIKLDRIEAEIMDLLTNTIHMSEYLSKFPERTKILIENMKSYPNTKLYFEILNDPKKLRIHLETIDRPGLLYFLSQIFYLSDFNVLDFLAKTEDKFVKDSFTIQKKSEAEFTDRNLQEIERLIKKFI